MKSKNAYSKAAVEQQRFVRPPKCKIDAVWYRLEFLDDDGKWKDAGDVYEEETKRWCRGEMVCVNFWPHKVRMVQHFHAYFPIGKIKDMGKDCYKPRKRSNEQRMKEFPPRTD